MSIDQIVSEALRLPVKQRALLAESLWESLEDSFEGAVVSDDTAATALALERDRQIETGEVKVVTHDEMMGRLRR
jgi:putative addiction module component (TIGR02574 family)